MRFRDCSPKVKKVTTIGTSLAFVFAVVHLLTNSILAVVFGAAIIVFTGLYFLLSMYIIIDFTFLH